MDIIEEIMKQFPALDKGICKNYQQLFQNTPTTKIEDVPPEIINHLKNNVLHSQSSLYKAFVFYGLSDKTDMLKFLLRIYHMHLNNRI